MDKEFGSNQLAPDQVGWDWFSLRLEDGRDVMLYVLRAEDGTVSFRNGTVIPPSGEVRYLNAEDWQVTITRRWKSKDTNADYPAGWTIIIPSESLDLEIEPAVADQENRSHVLPNLFYWEGSVIVRSPNGHALGRGYVELTGYGGRLPL